MAVLGLCTKIKKGDGTAFGARFLHDFSKKNVSYLILYRLTSSMSHLFSLSNEIGYSVLISTIAGVINFKIYLKYKNLKMLRTRRVF